MIFYDRFDEKCDITDKYVMKHDNYTENVGPISVGEIENLAYKVLSNSWNILPLVLEILKYVMLTCIYIYTLYIYCWFRFVFCDELDSWK